MPKVLHFYNPPLSGVTEPEKLAKLVDVICITPGIEDREPYVRAMKKVNPGLKAHFYLLQHGAHLKYDGKPNRNQIMWNVGEAADYIKRYPNMPLHYPDGSLVLKNQKRDYVVMNSVHAVWRDLMKRRVAEIAKRAPEFEGVFYDDFGVDKRVNGVGPVDLREYKTREAYFANTKAYLTYLRDQVTRPQNLRMVINLQSPREFLSDFNQAVDIMAQATDSAVMVEFYMYEHDGDFSLSHWETSFLKAEKIINSGLEFWGTFQVDPRRLQDRNSADYKLFEFFLYSHMLLDNGNCAIRVADEYSVFVDVPLVREVDKLLGKPLGKYRVKDGVYTREFENFILHVTPSKRSWRLEEKPIVIPTINIKLQLELEVPENIAERVKAALTKAKLKVE